MQRTSLAANEQMRNRQSIIVCENVKRNNNDASSSGGSKTFGDNISEEESYSAELAEVELRVSLSLAKEVDTFFAVYP